MKLTSAISGISGDIDTLKLNEDEKLESMDLIMPTDENASSPPPPQDGNSSNNDVVTQIVSRLSSRLKDDTLTAPVTADAAIDKQQQLHKWEGWSAAHNQSRNTDMISDGKDDLLSLATNVPPQDQSTLPTTMIKKPKSILKKHSLLSSNKKPSRRIKFNDMMTVFCDSFGTSIVAMNSGAVVNEDIYSAYEPPPEYQDCVEFEPPDEYKDDRFDAAREAKKVDAMKSVIVTSFCEEEKRQVTICDDAIEKFGCDSSDETLTDDNAVKAEVDNKDSFSTNSVALPESTQEVKDDEKTDTPVNSLLTEENLKQHEQMMKKEGVTTQNDLPSTPLSSSPATAKKLAPKNIEELSPPLKQLSVQVEPPPPGDDWQIELSPLNSVSTQETESDSSLSSQDTIIMMTSDECKRNEEHIKESMKIYEGLKKVDSSSLSSSGSDETKSSTVESESPSSGSQTSSSGGTADGWTSDDIRRVIERNAMRRSIQRYTEARKKQNGSKKAPYEPPNKQASLADRIKQLTCIDNDTDSGVDSEKSGSDSSSSSSIYAKKYPSPRQTESFNQMQRPEPACLTSRQRHSLAYHGYISPLIGNVSSPPRFSRLSIHRSASEMNVPSSQNVGRQPMRERHHSGPDKAHTGVVRCLSANEESNYDKSICDPSTINRLGIESNRFNSRLADGGVDELELFVKQDSDRIDRIRQRYSYSSEADSCLEVSPEMLVRKPSVRGIKPKFGSTTEILQQMQTEIQPPIYASPRGIGNHMTWPYHMPESAGSPSSSRHPHMPSSQSANVIKHIPEHSIESKNQGVTPPMHIRRGRDCADMVFARDERGAPEGASSSPKVSSDPVCPTFHKPVSDENIKTGDGVIFYSMNV